ncbi:MAG: 4-hydroxy-tetrahydrodipicolinate reductase [candidate division WOR-3 bacterium]
MESIPQPCTPLNLLRLVVCGARGRMGRTVADLALTCPDIELMGGIEHPSSADIGQRLGAGILSSDLTQLIPRADVVIDFSTPGAALSHLQLALAHAKPFVLGVTGFDPEQERRIREASLEIPIVYAPNFSVGMTVLLELVALTAKWLGPEFDTEILEIHHRNKKDAPSGSALRLAQVIGQATGRTDIVCGRHGQDLPKPLEQIGLSAVRSGDTVGEHWVLFGTDGERLELVHRVSNRKAFAQGALAAARFIAKQKPGLYSMTQVLGIQPLGS